MNISLLERVSRLRHESNCIGSGLERHFLIPHLQTTPELLEQGIDYIRAHPDPSTWTAVGPNCSGEVASILSKFKLDNGSRWRVRQGMTAKILWHSPVSRYNPNQN
jgi:hypothetical protein